VAANVEPGVEMRVESDAPARPAEACRLRIRMLGSLEIRRNGAVLPLPASRKVKALLAYLALAPRETPRSQLCELLWDVPNDPRGELRWCLSKIRRLVDEPDRQRLLAREDAVRLDLTGCFVDAVEVQRAMKDGSEPLDPGKAAVLEALFGGELLEGLEMERSPAAAAWLAGQRRRLHGAHVALVERLATRSADEEAFRYLEKWLALAPFDRRAHELLLGALARSGRLREGEEHLQAAARRFEEEGLDAGVIRRAWHSAREQEDPGHVSTPARRASVAVMPFQGWNGGADRPGWADALAHDVIVRLARLRSVFVISEGTVFALKDRRLSPEASGRMLNVDYLVAGSVRVRGDRLLVEVQLDETRTARLVWSERLDHPRDGAFDVIEEIGNRIVASIASEIEANECSRAILKPPSSLDAWEAYHRGLWHMYRFTKSDNATAQRFFEQAVSLDPTFSRAHAGLSFTHWQSAFQDWADREPEIAHALESARRGMLVDDRDPAVHWAQGRALWLRGLHDQSVLELQQAVDLSPNFAQGHYSLAFVQAQAGDPLGAIAAADRSRSLSPFDPLLFGMLGARAIALVRLGRYPEAADAAARAAARPNAHAHIFAVAAFSLALHGALEEARAHAAAARRILPGYTFAHFRNAFRLDPEGVGRFAEGARRIGMV
jgi:DNA-binding SARP family transcriptional activator